MGEHLQPATEALKLHKGSGSVLRTQQVVTLLELHKLGKTQTEIAHTLGCDQGTVSRWLAKLTDTTELASSYLRGKALHMAKNVVKNGQARDHVAALKGLKVLEDDNRQMNVAIGISLPGMPGVTFASESSTVSVEKP
jgi:orotate phosphoribosyltransferase-like protein